MKTVIGKTTAKKETKDQKIEWLEKQLAKPCTLCETRREKIGELEKQKKNILVAHGILYEATLDKLLI